MTVDQFKKSWWALGPAWTAGFLCGIVLLLSTSVATFMAFRELGRAREHVEHTYEVLRIVDRIPLNMSLGLNAQRAFLLRTEPEMLDRFREYSAALVQTIAELERRTADNPEQQQRIAELRRLVATRIDELSKTASIAADQGIAAAISRVEADESRALRGRILDLAASMGQTEQDLLVARHAHVRTMRWLNSVAMWVALLLCVGVVAAAFLANADLARRRDRLHAETLSRIRAQGALDETQEQFRITLASIGDGVISTDRQGCVTFMNTVAEELTGWRLSDAGGKPISEVFHIVNEQTRAAVENPVTRVLAEGRIVGLANHTVLISRRGTEVPIDDSGAPIRDAGGAIRGAVLVFRDISERYEAERERKMLLESERAARGEAERAARIKDEFLANLSHELRTPLNSILGWTQLVRRGTLSPEDHAQAVETIERNARLQSQLISDLLDMSSIMSGKLRVDLRPTNLAAVVDAIIDSARPSASAKGVEIVRTVDPVVGPIAGDFNRLQQIVWNLLSNAIKFTPGGGRVSVAVSRRGKLVNLTVSDTGMGITPAFLPHVFDRFRQEDSSRRRRHGGLGLGLAIVKQLVDRHNGEITVESDGEGRGATFTVSFPVCDSQIETLAPHSGGGSGESLALKGLRILVVDDDGDARELVGRILEERGCVIERAASGADALAAIERHLPDMLVSDIGMPEMDGYELIRRVRALSAEHGGRVIAIALTAFARPEDRTRAALAGYSTHIAKPLDPEELVAVARGFATNRGQSPD